MYNITPEKVRAIALVNKARNALSVSLSDQYTKTLEEMRLGNSETYFYALGYSDAQNGYKDSEETESIYWEGFEKGLEALV